MTESYPFVHHPCYSFHRENLWERIHLPIAKLCNVKCSFCDHNTSTQCHTGRPGSGSQLMSLDQALERIHVEKSKRPSLRIVAISGPGDPLFNEVTFDLLRAVRPMFKDIEFCLSTNGVLLSEWISELVELGLKTLTVTVNAVSPITASRVYEWALIDGKRVRGYQMGVEITERQERGIKRAARRGVFVKVNTVLIPGHNNNEVIDIAKMASLAGASLHNIVPLFPFAKMRDIRRPTQSEISEARSNCSKYLPQFTFCQQCRCDVVGIPGSDTIL